MTIGSIAATTILSTDTSFLDGMIAVIVLVALQYIVTKLDVHFKNFSIILKSNPTLVYYDGEYLRDNMKKMRITQKYILQEIRVQSGTLIEDVDAVILESNGKISVIKFGEKNKLESLKKYA